MPETTPLIKAALNLRVGAGFDVYCQNYNFYLSELYTAERTIKKPGKKPLKQDFLPGLHFCQNKAIFKSS